MPDMTVPDKKTRSRPQSGIQKKKSAPNPIDLHVGLRVRQRRTLIGMSQEALAKNLNMSFQQVQKYECGANRISSSRLYLLTKILNTDISYFFEGLPHSVGNESCDTSDVPMYSMMKRETIELVRAYSAIKDPAVRNQLYNLIVSLDPAEQTI